MRWPGSRPRCAAGFETIAAELRDYRAPGGGASGVARDRAVFSRVHTHAVRHRAGRARDGPGRHAPPSPSTGRRGHPSRGVAGPPTFPPIACVVRPRSSWRQVQSARRLIYAEPLLNDAAPPARAGTIAAERVLGVAEGGSTAATGAITLPTSFVPVTLRGRYEGAGRVAAALSLSRPRPGWPCPARRASRPGGACRAAGAVPQHRRRARARRARLRDARRRRTRRGMATRDARRGASWRGPPACSSRS